MSLDKPLSTLTAADLRALLLEALGGEFQGIVSPGNDPWEAELYRDGDGYRFVVDQIPGNRVWMRERIAAVNVTLESDRVGYERTLADDEDDVWVDEQGDIIEDVEEHDREMEGLAWEAHVERSVDYWVQRIADQVSEYLDRDFERIVERHEAVEGRA